MIAHQRLIRERMIASHPRMVPPTLAGYCVELISRAEARPVIMNYEWLGTLGKSTVFVGLLSPSREIEGVACFGHGPAGATRSIIGEPALCLERGACVHYAPPNAASFLINSACKMVFSVCGIARFFAYADPMAGEYGAVYQAANWLYLGQGLDGAGGRKRRFFVLPPGAEDKPENWRTTRALRSNLISCFRAFTAVSKPSRPTSTNAAAEPAREVETHAESPTCLDRTVLKLCPPPGFNPMCRNPM